jgi:peptidyl-prolyl cis-trans isomerase C
MANPQQKAGSMNQGEFRQKCRVLGGLILVGMLAGAAYGQGQSAPNPPTSAASAKTPAELTPASPNKVVMKVGNEQVTQADLDYLIGTLNPQTRKSLEEQGRRALGNQYAMLLLLSQQALSQHLDTSPTFQREMAMQRRQILAQTEYKELLRTSTPTPAEVSQYFSAHLSDYEEAIVREAVVLKKQPDAKDDTPGLSPEEAMAKAEAIRKALVAGTDPKKVAEQFDVPNVVRVDPETRTVRRGTLRPEMEKAVLEMKPGDVSKVFDLPQALVVIQLQARRNPELKDVSAEIENTLRQEKVKTALENMKKSANIWMDESYFSAPQATPATPAQPPAKPSPQP